MKKVKQSKGTEWNQNATSGGIVRNGFSLQTALEQRPECSEGMSPASNWEISLIDKRRASTNVLK